MPSAGGRAHRFKTIFSVAPRASGENHPRVSDNALLLQAAMPLRPPLKWAGGKRWLVPHLMTLWRPFSERRLVEPFCGALAVTLGLRPERALLADRNPHLINFLNWVKRGLEITLWMENDKELFNAHRKRFNELLQNGGEAGTE